jgi:hypothetical protein
MPKNFSGFPSHASVLFQVFSFMPLLFYIYATEFFQVFPACLRTFPDLSYCICLATFPGFPTLFYWNFFGFPFSLCNVSSACLGTFRFMLNALELFQVSPMSLGTFRSTLLRKWEFHYFLYDFLHIFPEELYILKHRITPFNL